MEELERLVADERKKFQVVAERLAEQQFEADKHSQQKQENWHVKIRELQKEKYALSIRLQVLYYQLWKILSHGQMFSLRALRPPQLREIVQYPLGDLLEGLTAQSLRSDYIFLSN